MSDDPDMLDDDAAMEEWLALSDAEQDAEVERAMAEHMRWWNSLTIQQQMAVDTRNALRRIIENRARLRDPKLCTIEYVVGLWKDGIRRNQKRLVKIRVWRSTGVYPGEA